MADVAQVRANVGKMLEMNAPEADIDQYIAEEGFTVDDIRNAASPSMPLPEVPRPDGGTVENIATFAGEQTAGLPVVGEYVKSGVDWLSAIAAKGLNKVGVGDETSPAATMSVDEMMGLAQKNRERLAAENPNFALGGNISGNVIGSVAAAEAAPAAFGMRAGAGLTERLIGGAAGNAGLAAADTAVRGGDYHDVGKSTAMGAVFGAAAPGLGAAVKGGANLIRGGGSGHALKYFRPKDAAKNLVASAVTEDIKAGTELGGAQYLDMLAEGDPVRNIDLYGGNLRGLGKWATKADTVANKAKAILGKRHEGQLERLETKLEDISGGPVNRTQRIDDIKSGGQAFTDPLYKHAMSVPHAQSMWSTKLQQLTAAPEMQAAIRRAEKTAQSHAAASGLPMPRPLFKHHPDGSVSLLPGGAIPNLHFWDIARRELSAIKQKAFKKNLGGKATTEKVFNEFGDEIDRLVPEYKVARGSAADDFGEADAVDAGAKLVNGSYTNMQQLAQKSAKYQSWERKAMEDGAIDALIGKLKQKALTGDVTPVFTPLMKDKLKIAFSKAGADRIESAALTETVFKQAHDAMAAGSNAGFGSLAADAAFIGGGGAYGASQGDVSSALRYGIAGFAIRRFHGRANRKVMEEIGEMVLSDDPAVMARAVKMAENSQQFRDSMEAVSEIIQKIGNAGALAGAQSLVGDN